MSTLKDLKSSFITRDTRDTEEVSSVMLLGKTKLGQLECTDDDSTKCNEDCSISFRNLLSYAPKYYLESIPFMFNRMNPYLLNMISLVFVAFYGSATLTAGFGLGNAIFMFFWQTFTQVNGETQGISCSKAFGAQDYKNMRLGFYRGLIWNYVITVISAILYSYIDVILISAGFEASMVEQAHAMVVSLIPALFIQTINEMIRNYLMSQKVSKPFVWINLASFAFFPVGGYYIIYASGWGIAGFGLFKGLVETINCIGLCWAMKKYGHEESLRREPLREILKLSEVKSYMKQFGSVLMGWYASYFGLEVNTILCGLMQDTVIMACWVSYMNVFAIIWTVGAGLSISTRTACGVALGENKPLVAKYHAFMGFTLSCVYSICFSIIIICFHQQIAEMFTEVPAVFIELKWQIVLVGILAAFAGTGPTGATMFRVIGKTGFYTLMMIINQVVVSTTISALGLFIFKWGAAGVGYAFLVSWLSTMLVTIIYMTKLDWERELKKVK